METSSATERDPLPKRLPQQNPAVPGVPTSFAPGAGTGFFDKQSEEAQFDNKLENVEGTLNQSYFWSAVETAADTPKAVGELFTSGTADLEPFREELTKDIPLHLQDNVMGSLTKAGATARRDRILEDISVATDLSQQTGISAIALQMGASMIDVDLPLAFLSGGTYQAARTAGAVARSVKAVTGSTRAARLAGDVAVGVSGAVIGESIRQGVGAVSKDTYDASDFIASMLAGAAMGGVLNGAAGTVRIDRGLWGEVADAEYNKVASQFEAQVQRDMMDDTHPINSNEPFPAEADADTSTPRKPILFDEDGREVISGGKPAVRNADGEELVDTQGVGAQAAGPIPRAVSTDSLNLKGQKAPQSIIDQSIEMQAWRQNYRYDALKREDTSNPIVNLLTGGAHYVVGANLPRMKVAGFGLNGGRYEIDLGQVAGAVFTMGQRDFANMVHSRAPTANFVAAEILESGSGLVRRGSTAGLNKEIYHGSAMLHSAQLMQDSKSAWISKQGLNPVSIESHRAFSRAVRLEMDAMYRTGRPASKEFKDLIDGIDRSHAEILDRMKGRTEETSVRGSRDVDHKPGWFRYDWSGSNFLRVRKATNNKAMVDAFQEGYMRASGLDPNLARKVAKAVVRRFTDRGLGVDGSDARIMDLDSRVSIEKMLKDNGVSKKDVAAISKRLTADARNRSKKGFLKDRIDIDMNTPIAGSKFKLVDLLSDDLERSVQQYVGDAAGSAALASKGIRDSADLRTMMQTINYERVALGEEPFAKDYLDAIFSQFGGGAHKGYMMGTATGGVNPVVSMLAKATRASLLQRAGLTQVMDFSNQIVGNGLARTMEPIMAKLGWDKPGTMSQADFVKLNDELRSLSVVVGQDHILFAPHLSIDETDLAENVAMQMAQNGLNSVERATNYASGMIHVTAAQQKVSAAAISTNVLRTIAGEKTNLTDRMLRDIGLEPEDLAELRMEINNGSIKVEGGKVELDASKWSDELKDNFGQAIMRGVHQQTQKSIIGETSVWMNTDVGKLLSSLKTFALVATQKQAARQLMIGGKAHFLGAAAWQMGFAYAVLQLAQTIGGTEMSAIDRGRLAAAYSPTLGVISMVTDPITTMLGMDDLNFSPYGRYSSYIDTPVFEQTQKLIKSGGAIKNVLTGEGDYEDKTNARAMFFMNYYGMKRFWDSM
jgi:hypothetical protein